jgi:hypothetical protein
VPGCGSEPGAAGLVPGCTGQGREMRVLTGSMRAWCRKPGLGRERRARVGSGGSGPGAAGLGRDIPRRDACQRPGSAAKSAQHHPAPGPGVSGIGRGPEAE